MQPINETLSILTVPAFDDNYLWIIHNGQDAIVVDPGDAAAILQALGQHNLNLRAILLTHHHSDHIGGVELLVKQCNVPVYGPANDGILGINHALVDGDIVQIKDLDMQLEVIAVPGHTLGHIAYYVPEQAWLFCGDTLFAGGCGRLFEGTPAQMLHSLEKLAALPDQTSVFCAHEYTLSNLRFASAVEPNNLDLQERVTREQGKRANGLPTVPTQIKLEKLTNPFLRSKESSVIAQLLALGKITDNADAVSHFAALREWKNNFS
ncbi:MAG: hydroxyacylglutathione hydrolase [Undibacterium sp.]|nr:hydroxyacylglutathione hydrolase [Undibacterium sp.]